MQSMISMNKNGKPVNTFFDVNWERNRIENIVVRDGSERLTLTLDDIAVITNLIEAEVTAILTESALDKAEGKAVFV